MVRKTIDLGTRRSPHYRVWRGRRLSPLEEVRMFFNDEGPVPNTYRKLRKLLADSGIEHIFIGATALSVHKYRRATEDVDVVLRREDLDRFKQQFVGKQYQPVAKWARKFYDPETQVTFDILVAGEVAGNQRKQQDVKFPDPSEAVVIDDVPVPSLARLVELKLVTWRYRDWADVVELIRIHDLDESFAGQVHSVARPFYLQCYDQKVEEDRYNPEIHDRHPDEPAS